MYNKKIKFGALALALSISAANVQTALHTPVAFASEISASNDENSTDDTKSSKALVDESGNVKKSTRYNNATDQEKKAYNDAISALDAELQKENPQNLASLEENVLTAKQNLSGNAYATGNARDGLASTIAIASKIKSNKNIDAADKTKIDQAIKSANDVLTNVEKSNKDIEKANTDLSSFIESFVEEKNLDVKKYTLSGEELTNIKSADVAAYGKAWNNLYDLQTSAKSFYDKNHENRNTEAFNKLVDELSNAKEVYDNLNASADDLNQAYDKLYKALDAAQVAADKNNTELNRLKDELDTLTKENFTDANKSNKIAKSTYENALADAKKALENKDASPVDIQRSINNVKLAKLSLKPVQTVVIDDGKTDQERAEEELAKANKKLDALLNEVEEVKKSDLYKNAKAESKSAYDAAIKDAKLTSENKNRAIDQVNQAISLIETAKNGFDTSKDKDVKPSNADDKKEDLKTLLAKLRKYTEEENRVTQSKSYREASPDYQRAYKDAIKKALGLQAKHANGHSASLKDLEEAVNEIETVLENISYSDETEYPDTLQALVDEAKEFRAKEEFINISTSKELGDKKLVETYNELIKNAKKYIESGENDEATIVDYIDRINEVKMAIVGEISQVELNLRGEVRKANSFINEKAYKNAKSNSDDDIRNLANDYDDLIQKAIDLLGNVNRDDADMLKLIEDLENTRIAIENPSENNINVSKITEYIDLIEKIYAHPDYEREVPQAAKDRLQVAVKEAGKITEESKAEEIEAVLSDIEAALNNDVIKKIVEDIKSKSAGEVDLHEIPVKELVSLAKNVQEDSDFDDVSLNQKQSIKEALDALENALEREDQDAIEAARIRLISALNQDRVRPITEKVAKATRSESTSEDDELIKESSKLVDLISLAEKVKDHKDFEEIDEELKNQLSDEITKAKTAINSKELEKINESIYTLSTVLAKKEFSDIIAEVKDEISSDIRSKLIEIVAGDKAFRKTVKYTKAQTSFKEAYEKSLEAAKNILDKDDANDEDLKEVYDNISKAIKDLDGDQYKDRLQALTTKYKDNSSKITDPKIKTDIEEKIKALASDDKTMDDLVAVETELTNALPKDGAKVTAQTTGSGTVQSPGQTATTRTVPVTTTKTVPATVTPGSIVRTGIKSVIGYVLVLAIAILGYIFLFKKDKDGKNKVNNTDKKEKMTFEGDKDDTNK